MSKLHDYEFVIIMHAILYLNEREIQKKKVKEKTTSRGLNVRIDFQFPFEHFQPQLFLKWIHHIHQKREGKIKEKRKKKKEN